MGALPAEGVEDVPEMSAVFVVVRIVEDVFVVAVGGVVDVLVLRHHADVMDADAYPQTGVAVPVEVRRLRRRRDVVRGVETARFQQVVHQNVVRRRANRRRYRRDYCNNSNN